jgi:hypothetical protein
MIILLLRIKWIKFNGLHSKQIFRMFAYHIDAAASSEVCESYTKSMS